MSQFSRTQEAIERLFAYIDNLVVHGKTENEAIDHASHEFGILRLDVVELLADRRIGSSGETHTGCVSTPHIF